MVSMSSRILGLARVRCACDVLNDDSRDVRGGSGRSWMLVCASVCRISNRCNLRTLFPVSVDCHLRRMRPLTMDNRKQILQHIWMEREWR